MYSMITMKIGIFIFNAKSKSKPRYPLLLPKKKKWLLLRTSFFHSSADWLCCCSSWRDRLWCVRVICVYLYICVYCEMNCISICSLRVTFILIFRSHSLSRQSHVADENLYLMTAICVYVCVCSWHVSCSLTDVFCAHSLTLSLLPSPSLYMYSLSRISIYS